MAPSFSSRCDVAPPAGRVQTPVRPGTRKAVHAERRGGANHDFLELAHVPAHVAADLAELQDGIADDLAGAVIGDVAAAIGMMELDAQLVAARIAARADSACGRCVRA